MAFQNRLPFGTLFNAKTVRKALREYTFHLSDAQRKAAAAWAAQAANPLFAKAKETAVRGEFIQQVLVTVLGYAPYRADGLFSLATEETLGPGSADVALGRFEGRARAVLAPFELKGPGTRDLDAIMPGRHKSPVQQAWEYAIDAPGAKWVLVSNCAEIRLYAFGYGRDLYEFWDLARLGEERELERLWLFLNPAALLEGRTGALLKDSASEDKDITDKLYKEYRETRNALIDTLQAQPPRLSMLAAIEHAQTILDRVLFIAFAEDTKLLPEKTIANAYADVSKYRPNAWDNFRTLFDAVDKGNEALGIPAYNGGLFKADPAIDALKLTNFICEKFAALADYDYGSDVSVSILGHIFEQSISDIEAMRAQAQGLEPPKVKKSKRDGVVYTPEFITRFIVEETIGRTLQERFDAILEAHGVTRDGEAFVWPDGTEPQVWRAYAAALKGLTVLDPACGSGAFLIAAFDYLAGEYARVAGRLTALGLAAEIDLDRDILASNLYGVDLNPEPVEITKLALWLKTARPGKRLQDLDASIHCGNSIIADKAEHGRAFDWQAAFPAVFASGGFDIVIGNPPYVRMELLKPFKPYLAKHYSVAAERADLYAYFFERGFECLKPGGRLGYISSSTFLRTGSGEPLRHYLRTRAQIESVIDFGDIQVFEGVTTYPAILTMRKPEAKAAADDAALRFLKLEKSVPEDLGRTFRTDAAAMPRARLGDGSWQLEGDALARLRAKIKTGRKTLGEVYGPPLRGIVTGLNDAFVVSRETRNALVARDARSSELLVPFLRGENIKRWRVESEDLFLINTPKGKVDIAAYPAIRDHLLPFKDRLVKRATKQEWFELQQAQLAYQGKMARSKIIYQDICNSNPFVPDTAGFFVANTCYFIPCNKNWMSGFLNSRLCWFFWTSLTTYARGGYLRLFTEFVEQTPLPATINPTLEKTAADVAKAAGLRLAHQRSVLRRIPDLCPPERVPKLNDKLRRWWTLDFAAFRAEVKKAFKADIPLKDRNDWENYLRAEGDKVRALTAQIEAAERDIDAIVYKLFDLTPGEITLLEASLEGQY